MKKAFILAAATLALCSALGTAIAQDKAAPAPAPAKPAPAAAAPAPAAAASVAKEPTAQQNKMASCNKDAEGKKGDERKDFMKTCLSAKKMTPQQEKMKSCNADAKTKDLKGDERKKFMSTCLKG
jgi:psiF repeat